MDIVDALESQGDEYLKERFLAALACVRRTLDLFGPDGVAFSFNGGKDSTVLLHILRAAIASRTDSGIVSNGGPSSPGLGGICTFIFERQDDFPEILDFVRLVDKKHLLGVEELEGDFQSGLRSLLSRRPIRAVILGTRRGDPNAAGQDVFCPSSADWPPFMRVNPILEWSYADVWAFLRTANVEYCSLYDRGYTSVGSIHDTHPNSALCKEDGAFAPAHMLADGRMERAGRASKGTPKASEGLGYTRSAALIIIGDEILSGKVEDLNSRFLCQELFSLGWRVNKIVIIGDEIAAIRDEVHAASESHDLVFTTGGVGPTPDDVTMAGIAQAVGYPLTRDQSLEERLRAYFGEHITDAHLKMAETPSGETDFLEVTAENGRPSPFPIIRIRNTFVLPGIPALLQQKWKVLKEALKKLEELPSFHSVQLRLKVSDETQITPALKEVAGQVGSSVSVGSYPVCDQQDGAQLVLSLESKDVANLAHAREELLHRLPNCVLSEQRDSSNLSDQELPDEATVARQKFLTAVWEPF